MEIYPQTADEQVQLTQFEERLASLGYAPERSTGGAYYWDSYDYEHVWAIIGPWLVQVRAIESQLVVDAVWTYMDDPQATTKHSTVDAAVAECVRILELGRALLKR